MRGTIVVVVIYASTSSEVETNFQCNSFLGRTNQDDLVSKNIEKLGTITLFKDRSENNSVEDDCSEEILQSSVHVVHT